MVRGEGGVERLVEGGAFRMHCFRRVENLETRDRFEKREIKFSLVFSIGVNPFLEGEIMGGWVP